MNDSFRSLSAPCCTAREPPPFPGGTVDFPPASPTIRESRVFKQVWLNCDEAEGKHLGVAGSDSNCQREGAEHLQRLDLPRSRWLERAHPSLPSPQTPYQLLPILAEKEVG